MAHKSVAAAVADIKEQQRIDYRAIIVWCKDWERWAKELSAEIDLSRYNIKSSPTKQTREQLVIAEKL